MIGTIDIAVNAAHPNLPLQPIVTFAGSPSSIRLRDVPKAVGKWRINAVALSYTLPNNVAGSAACVLTGGVWVGGIPACATTGSVASGFAVVASGTDENGVAINGYVLGRGDIKVLSSDSTVTVGDTKYALRYCQTQPTSPVIGDCAVIGGSLKWYNGTTWIALGGEPAAYLQSAAVSNSKLVLTPNSGTALQVAAGDIGGEAAGTASSAVAAHDASAAAHSALLAAKADATALAAETARATAAEASKQAALVAGPGINLTAVTAYAWTVTTGTDAGKTVYTITVPLIAESVRSYYDVSFTQQAGQITPMAGTEVAEYKDPVTAFFEFCDRTPSSDDNYNISVTSSVQASLAKADSSVQSFSAVGGVTPAVASGVADLSTLFTRVDTSESVTIEGVLNNAELEKSIVKAVSSNFTDADTTSY